MKSSLQQVYDCAELYRGMTTREASDFLGIPMRNMEMHRRDGTGPAFVKISPRNIRYRLIDLIAFQEQRVTTGSAK